MQTTTDRQPGHGFPPIDHDYIRKLHRRGLTAKQIRDRYEEVKGHRPSVTAIYRALRGGREAGLGRATKLRGGC